MSAFTAQYHGECPNCGEELKGREAIFNSSGDVVHVKCPASIADPPQGTKLCIKCWTYHNGDCL